MFYIIKRNYGSATQSYYTGLDDLELLYSTNFSDAEPFDSMEICFNKYKWLKDNFNQETNGEYYIFIDSIGEDK